MLNENKFREIYEGFVTSGLTAKDYCSNLGLAEGTFYYWQNKLKNTLPPKNGFVPVVLKTERNEASISDNRKKQYLINSKQPPELVNKTGLLEISYPNGVRVKLDNGADLETLRSLIELIH